MTINSLWFYAVYLSQVLLISLYVPSRVLRRARCLIETFPPSEYPKLYPEPLARIHRKLRVYRNLNAALLLLGIGLLAAAWLFDYPSAARFGADRTAQAYWYAYLFLQILPTLLISFWVVAHARQMKAAAQGRIRRAELKARRLFEFVSPALLGTAVAMYVGATVALLYLEGFQGWRNLVSPSVMMIGQMTIINTGFAGLFIWILYGKKQDPHQAPEDRARHLRLCSQSLLTISILVSVLMVGSRLLQVFELYEYLTLISSIYVQVVVISSAGLWWSDRLDPEQFEVYTTEPNRGAALATNK